ncbi:MAG: hypothetical protein MI922_05030 [Bacteroidales bacterium]|nr:hypothetical protein [Bacteroidales bacterium]
MDIYRIIHLILRNLKYIFTLPLLSGALIFVLTINQEREYETRASIFTGITASTSLENLGNNRVDYFATKTAYNNLLSLLNSRSVMEETALRLLSRHMILDQAELLIISSQSYTNLRQILPLEIKELVVSNNENETYLNLKKYMQKDKHNFVYGLLNLNHPHYSYKAISKIKAVQVDGSDIVELTYTSNDAAIASQTLSIMLDVFLRRYSELKINQSSKVVEYFEKQLKKSSVKLDDAEDRLLEFNKSNNIINYYEQTKHISSQQEKIEIKLQDILMEYQAAEAVLVKLEEESSNRFNINLKNKEILNIRKELIVVSQKLAELELHEGDTSDIINVQVGLSAAKMNLTRKLQNKLDSLYIYEYNSQGLAIETILNDWLKTVIDFESARARLLAMQAKSKEFQDMYKQYAPLGAILKRIEREIDVNEKEYLEILHHLGLAKLKQQNEELMSNMKLLDEPQFPLDPKPTKRKVLVIVVSFFTAIIIIFGIVVFELLDKTIKTADRFTSLSDIGTAGILTNNLSQPGIDALQLNQQGLKLIVEQIVNACANQKENSPTLVQFISNWNGEGKSFIIDQLMNILGDLGLSSFHLQLNDEKKFNNTQLLLTNQYIQLIDKESIKKHHVILIETPARSNTVFNSSLLNSAQLSYYVARADRTWSNADTRITNDTKLQLNGHLKGILNLVPVDDMENVIGEIQKKRSRMRRLGKQIVKRFIA